MRGLIAVLFLPVAIFCHAESAQELTIDMAKSFAAIANKNTPKMVDEYTRMERVYSNSLDIIFEYTILAAVPEYSEAEHSLRLKSNFKSIMCSTPKFHGRLLKKGVRQIYRYSDKNGELQREYTFSINDCV